MAAVNPAAAIAAPAQGPASLWDRLSGSRLRLRDTVTVDTLRYRGHAWYLLRDALSGQQFRLNQATYDVVAGLDGRRTLAQAWAGLPASTERADRQEEMCSVLLQLQGAGMLDIASVNDAQALIARQHRQRRQRTLSRWLRLLSPRLSLFDPDDFLQRSLPFFAWFFHPAALSTWLLIALTAGAMALMHWSDLALYGAQRLDDPRGWVLLVAMYPLVKAIHELGHGYAARRAGAAVNDMGITLLVFVPVPFVDASAASAVANKYQRMLVGAAGILVEILLAALAMFAWLQLDDGLPREAAFSVMLIGGISTLLFNGNPLLRFDGYYVFSDAIEIPNLATRAARYYGYLVRRYLLGVDGERSPVSAAGEKRWFLFYGAASTVYRFAIMVGIALFLIATIPTLGVLLAAWLVVAQLVLPLGRQVHYLLANPALQGRRLRAIAVVGGLLSSLFLALGLVPFPSSTQVDGIVLLPEKALVRAEVEGFLARQLVDNGSRVSRGQVLFELQSPTLETDLAVMRARIAELEARRDATGLEDRVSREIQAERLAELRTELRDLERRRASLVLHAPSDGVLRAAALGDPVGRLVNQGDLLGHVAAAVHGRVRVVAPQAEATRIREAVETVRVRLAESGGEVLEGRLLGEVPAASDLLPSAALGSRAGGSIPVDARDPKGLKTLQQVFAFDIAVPFTPALQYIGSRAYVRFEHASVPLLARWYDSVRRLVMSEIGE